MNIVFLRLISPGQSMVSLMNIAVKKTKIYACIKPSKKSKYRLNGIGNIAGHTNSTSAITTNPPRMFPKSRKQSAVGRIKTSMMFIGSITGIGSRKLLKKPFSPFLWIPQYSMRNMLIRARARVTFKSLVGGFTPKIPDTLETPRKIMTVII